MIGLGHIAVSLVLFVPSTVVVADPTFAELGGGNGDAPRVGLYGLQGCTTSTTDEACMQNTDMVEALDADHYLFVTGFEKGVLNCESLEHAQDAPVLRFNLTNSEEVTARKKSFQVTSGSAFSNKAERMVWTGEVIEPHNVFGGIPRSIAMSWISGCDVEAFMLKVNTPQHDGTTRATVTLPCTDADEPNQVCLLQVEHAAEAEALETSIVDGKEEKKENEEQETAPGFSRPRAHNLPSGDEGLDQNDGGAGGNNRHRYLRKKRDRDSNNSENPRRRYNSDGTTSPTTRRTRVAEEHRRLEREVSEGMATAHIRNPDVDAKDEDVRLLGHYLAASPPEREAFHERGVRRLSSGETLMPSGRVLTSSTTIDVMVLYTGAAMVASGTGTLMTEDQMETDIAAAFATANDALVDSGIEATLNVVHMQQVDFKEGLEMRTDLPIVASTPEFDSLRTNYGADLVQLIGFYEESCGTGYVMKTPTARFGDYGYSIVHVHCLLNLSHIHEIGHNLGANHDIASSLDIHDYAHAERHCTGDDPYRTIMAYDTDCVAAPRVPMFSTPDKSYLGKMLGSESTNNVRKIKESLSTVVNFRDRLMASDDAPRQQQPAPTPPSETVTPSTGTFQGCFRHSWSKVELANVPVIDYEHASRESCRGHCSAAGFLYYALEFGFMCSCGSRLPRESNLATMADCSLPCTSPLTSLSCGGNWHQAVFSVDANDVLARVEEGGKSEDEP